MPWVMMNHDSGEGGAAISTRLVCRMAAGRVADRPPPHRGRSAPANALPAGSSAANPTRLMSTLMNPINRPQLEVLCRFIIASLIVKASGWREPCADRTISIPAPDDDAGH